MTRTNSKWLRCYADGYDISGDARTIGPLNWSYDEVDLTGYSHAIKGVLPGHATIGIGTLNAVFDNTATTGVHNILATSGVMRTMLIAVGMLAEPAEGDPAFMGEFEQEDYMQDGQVGTYINIPFNSASARASSFLYDSPWGILSHEKSAETAVNSATGVDNPTGGATSFGGYMVYQVFAGNGTATISVDDSANNSTFAAVSGLTSGSINCSSPISGRVAIGRTATIRQYTRWQIAFGTATSVTFALGLSRAFH